MSKDKTDETKRVKIKELLGMERTGAISKNKSDFLASLMHKVPGRVLKEMTFKRSRSKGHHHCCACARAQLIRRWNWHQEMELALRDGTGIRRRMEEAP